jgi:hypothetical protein
MRSPRPSGRSIGILALLHLATGLITPYVLLGPLPGAVRDALGTVAGMEPTVRLAVVMLIVGGVIPVAIAVATWPALRERSPSSGLWLVALAGVSLALQVVEIQHYLNLLSLGIEHARGAAEATAATALAPMVRAAWRWAHYTHLLSIVGWLLFFFVVAYRQELVPRVIAAFGILTTLMQLGGITLPVLVGYRVPFPMEVWGMPLAGAYIALALWTIMRGLPAPTGANAVADR